MHLEWRAPFCKRGTMENLVIEYENLDHKVYPFVKGMSENRLLLPEKIPQEKLAKEMSISRTPLLQPSHFSITKCWWRNNCVAALLSDCSLSIRCCRYLGFVRCPGWIDSAGQGHGDCPHGGERGHRSIPSNSTTRKRLPVFFRLRRTATRCLMKCWKLSRTV